MKKALSLLITLLMVLTLSACHQHTWTRINCDTPKTCSICGKTKGSAIEHNWKGATCSSPKICLNCGVCEGVALEHAWIEATCTSPKTCSTCGKKQGTLASHNWREATCFAPKTCSVCGETEGTVASHNWKDATCISPKTCSACGETEGTVASHSWKNATCAEPKICTVCKKTEGSALSHNWQSATCTAAKTCSSCGKTEGSALGHSWETINVYTKKCKTCGTKEIDQSKLPVAIGNLTPCSGIDYYKENYNRQDIYSNKFSDGLFLESGTGFGWPKTCNTEYVLNQTYKKFTTTLMVSSDSPDFYEGKLQVYVDEVLVYDSNTINKKTQPINIEIDIANAMFIRVESTNYHYGIIMLADPTLHH